MVEGVVSGAWFWQWRCDPRLSAVKAAVVLVWLIAVNTTKFGLPGVVFDEFYGLQSIERRLCMAFLAGAGNVDTS